MQRGVRYCIIHRGFPVWNWDRGFLGQSTSPYRVSGQLPGGMTRGFLYITVSLTGVTYLNSDDKLYHNHSGQALHAEHQVPKNAPTKQT